MEQVIPFEQEDPELGKLVSWYMSKKFLGKMVLRWAVKSIDTWSKESGLERNDKCCCGSGLKFKKCCKDT
jgi:uncharacterized protein YecA (UPF0149 family)